LEQAADQYRPTHPRDEALVILCCAVITARYIQFMGTTMKIKVTAFSSRKEAAKFARTRHQPGVTVRVVRRSGTYTQPGRGIAAYVSYEVIEEWDGELRGEGEPNTDGRS
jgi:hypothetical protein